MRFRSRFLKQMVHQARISALYWEFENWQIFVMVYLDLEEAAFGSMVGIDPQARNVIGRR